MAVGEELEEFGVIIKARDVAMDEELEELAVITKARDVAGGRRTVITKARDVVQVTSLEEQLSTLCKELKKARRVIDGLATSPAGTSKVLGGSRPSRSRAWPGRGRFRSS